MTETDNATLAAHYGMLAAEKFRELRTWRMAPAWYFREKPRWRAAEEELIEWMVVFARCAGSYANAALDEQEER